MKLKGNINEELKDVKSEMNNYKTIFNVEVLIVRKGLVEIKKELIMYIMISVVLFLI